MEAAPSSASLLAPPQRPARRTSVHFADEEKPADFLAFNRGERTAAAQAAAAAQQASAAGGLSVGAETAPVGILADGAAFAAAGGGTTTTGTIPSLVIIPQQPPAQAKSIIGVATTAPSPTSPLASLLVDQAQHAATADHPHPASLASSLRASASSSAAAAVVTPQQLSYDTMGKSTQQQRDESTIRSLLTASSPRKGGGGGASTSTTTPPRPLRPHHTMQSSNSTSLSGGGGARNYAIAATPDAAMMRSSGRPRPLLDSLTTSGGRFENNSATAANVHTTTSTSSRSPIPAAAGRPRQQQRKPSSSVSSLSSFAPIGPNGAVPTRPLEGTGPATAPTAVRVRRTVQRVDSLISGLAAANEEAEERLAALRAEEKELRRRMYAVAVAAPPSAAAVATASSPCLPPSAAAVKSAASYSLPPLAASPLTPRRSANNNNNSNHPLKFSGEAEEEAAADADESPLRSTSSGGILVSSPPQPLPSQPTNTVEKTFRQKAKERREAALLRRQQQQKEEAELSGGGGGYYADGEGYYHHDCERCRRRLQRREAFAAEREAARVARNAGGVRPVNTARPPRHSWDISEHHHHRPPHSHVHAHNSGEGEEEGNEGGGEVPLMMMRDSVSTPRLRRSLPGDGAKFHSCAHHSEQRMSRLSCLSTPRRGYSPYYYQQQQQNGRGPSVSASGGESGGAFVFPLAHRHRYMSFLYDSPHAADRERSPRSNAEGNSDADNKEGAEAAAASRGGSASASALHRLPIADGGVAFNTTYYDRYGNRHRRLSPAEAAARAARQRENYKTHYSACNRIGCGGYMGACGGVFFIDKAGKRHIHCPHRKGEKGNKNKTTNEDGDDNESVASHSSEGIDEEDHRLRFPRLNAQRQKDAAWRRITAEALAANSRMLAMGAAGAEHPSSHFHSHYGNNDAADRSGSAPFGSYSGGGMTSPFLRKGSRGRGNEGGVGRGTFGTSKRFSYGGDEAFTVGKPRTRPEPQRRSTLRRRRRSSVESDGGASDTLSAFRVSRRFVARPFSDGRGRRTPTYMMGKGDGRRRRGRLSDDDDDEGRQQRRGGRGGWNSSTATEKPRRALSITHQRRSHTSSNSGGADRHAAAQQRRLKHTSEWEKARQQKEARAARKQLAKEKAEADRLAAEAEAEAAAAREAARIAALREAALARQHQVAQLDRRQAVHSLKATLEGYAAKRPELEKRFATLSTTLAGADEANSAVLTELQRRIDIRRGALEAANSATAAARAAAAGARRLIFDCGAECESLLTDIRAARMDQIENFVVKGSVGVPPTLAAVADLLVPAKDSTNANNAECGGTTTNTTNTAALSQRKVSFSASAAAGDGAHASMGRDHQGSLMDAADDDGARWALADTPLAAIAEEIRARYGGPALFSSSSSSSSPAAKSSNSGHPRPDTNPLHVDSHSSISLRGGGPSFESNIHSNNMRGRSASSLAFGPHVATSSGSGGGGGSPQHPFAAFAPFSSASSGSHHHLLHRDGGGGKKSRQLSVLSALSSAVGGHSSAQGGSPLLTSGSTTSLLSGDGQHSSNGKTAGEPSDAANNSPQNGGAGAMAGQMAKKDNTASSSSLPPPRRTAQQRRCLRQGHEWAVAFLDAADLVTLSGGQCPLCVHDGEDAAETHQHNLISSSSSSFVPSVDKGGGGALQKGIGFNIMHVEGGTSASHPRIHRIAPDGRRLFGSDAADGGSNAGRASRQHSHSLRQGRGSAATEPNNSTDEDDEEAADGHRDHNRNRAHRRASSIHNKKKNTHNYDDDEEDSDDDDDYEDIDDDAEDYTSYEEDDDNSYYCSSDEGDDHQHYSPNAKKGGGSHRQQRRRVSSSSLIDLMAAGERPPPHFSASSPPTAPSSSSNRQRSNKKHHQGGRRAPRPPPTRAEIDARVAAIVANAIRNGGPLLSMAGTTATHSTAASNTTSSTVVASAVGAPLLSVEPPPPKILPPRKQGGATSSPTTSPLKAAAAAANRRAGAPRGAQQQQPFTDESPPLICVIDTSGIGDGSTEEPFPQSSEGLSATAAAPNAAVPRGKGEGGLVAAGGAPSHLLAAEMLGPYRRQVLKALLFEAGRSRAAYEQWKRVGEREGARAAAEAAARRAEARDAAMRRSIGYDPHPHKSSTTDGSAPMAVNGVAAISAQRAPTAPSAPPPQHIEGTANNKSTQQQQQQQQQQRAHTNQLLAASANSAEMSASFLNTTQRPPARRSGNGGGSASAPSLPLTPLVPDSEEAVGIGGEAHLSLLAAVRSVNAAGHRQQQLGAAADAAGLSLVDLSIWGDSDDEEDKDGEALFATKATATAAVGVFDGAVERRRQLLLRPGALHLFRVATPSQRADANEGTTGSKSIFAGTYTNGTLSLARPPSPQRGPAAVRAALRSQSAKATRVATNNAAAAVDGNVGVAMLGTTKGPSAAPPRRPSAPPVGAADSSVSASARPVRKDAKASASSLLPSIPAAASSSKVLRPTPPSAAANALRAVLDV